MTIVLTLDRGNSNTLYIYGCVIYLTSRTALQIRFRTLSSIKAVPNSLIDLIDIVPIMLFIHQLHCEEVLLRLFWL